MKQYVLLMAFLLITSSFCHEFQCSFDQKYGDNNCWSVSLICESELYFLTHPKALSERKGLLTNLPFQRERICKALNFALHF